MNTSETKIKSKNKDKTEYFCCKYLVDNLKYYQIIVVGFIFKVVILLAFCDITSILDNSVEFSTPVTSFKSLKEGLFFINNDIQLYDGGIVYHPILLLKVLNFFCHKNSEIILFLIFQAIDSLNSYLLLQINFKFLSYYEQKTVKHDEKSQIKSLFPKKFTVSLLLSLFYGLNPLTILSSLSNSTILINDFCITLTLFSYIVLENSFFAIAALATAAYLSFNPIYLIIPFIGSLINRKHNTQNPIITTLVGLFYFIFSLSLLLYLAYISNDRNLNFLNSYKVLIVFEKINPNLGLWWYFFIEIFEFFKNFFISIFNIYSMVYILPITIRFQNLRFSNYSITNKYLIFPLILSYGFIILTKPYPNLNDLNYLFQLLVLLITQTNFKIISYLKMPTISLLLLLHAIILNPIFYYLWIYNGSGNSNFFYAINLVYALGLGSLLIDFIWGYLTMEYYFDGKNELDGTTIRLSQY